MLPKIDTTKFDEMSDAELTVILKGLMKNIREKYKDTKYVKGLIDWMKPIPYMDIPAVMDTEITNEKFKKEVRILDMLISSFTFSRKQYIPLSPDWMKQMASEGMLYAMMLHKKFPKESRTLFLQCLVANLVVEKMVGEKKDATSKTVDGNYKTYS